MRRKLKRADWDNGYLVIIPQFAKTQMRLP